MPQSAALVGGTSAKKTRKNIGRDESDIAPTKWSIHEIKSATELGKGSSASRTAKHTWKDKAVKRPASRETRRSL